MYHRIGKGGGRYWGKAGAGILFTDGNSVLLLRRADGTDNPHTWGLPGGKADGDESPMANAHREVREETGLSSIPGRRIEDFEHKDGHHRWTTFLYRVDEPFDVPQLSDEHEDWSWFDLEDLDEAELHPRLRKEVPGYLRAIRRRIATTQTFAEWVTLSSLLAKIESVQADPGTPIAPD